MSERGPTLSDTVGFSLRSVDAPATLALAAATSSSDLRRSGLAATASRIASSSVSVRGCANDGAPDNTTSSSVSRPTIRDMVHPLRQEQRDDLVQSRVG